MTPTPAAEFPPTFGTTRPYWPFADDERIALRKHDAGGFDPLREELRALLRASHVTADDLGPKSPGDTRDVTRALFRKLSVNHVLERVTNPDDPHYDADAELGELRHRPLTPHPSNLPVTPAVGNGPLGAGAGTTFPAFGVPDAALGRLENQATTDDGYTSWAIATVQQQEWHARRDRQNMARDIYTLLWTLAGSTRPPPTRTTPDPTPATPYTPSVRCGRWRSSPSTSSTRSIRTG